jgi:hypothetical protein
MGPEAKDEASDSRAVHALWLMPTGLFVFLLVGALSLSVG